MGRRARSACPSSVSCHRPTPSSGPADAGEPRIQGRARHLEPDDGGLQLLGPSHRVGPGRKARPSPSQCRHPHRPACQGTARATTDGWTRGEATHGCGRGPSALDAVSDSPRYRHASGRDAGTPMAGRRPRRRTSARCPYPPARLAGVGRTEDVTVAPVRSPPPAVVEALRSHRIRQLEERLVAGTRWKDQGYVFAAGNGSPLDPRNVLRAFHGALESAGLPRQPFHHLRHAYVTFQLEGGEELANVSKILGHADLGTTADLYAHLTPTIARRAADRMDAILAG